MAEKDQEKQEKAAVPVNEEPTDDEAVAFWDEDELFAQEQPPHTEPSQPELQPAQAPLDSIFSFLEHDLKSGDSPGTTSEDSAADLDAIPAVSAFSEVQESAAPVENAPSDAPAKDPYNEDTDPDFDDTSLSAQGAPEEEDYPGEPHAQVLGEVPDQPDQPQPGAFFDIPDNPPAVVSEDTEETPDRPRRRRRRKPGAVRVIANAIAWLMLVGFFLVVSLALLYYRYATNRLNHQQPDREREFTLTVNSGDRLSRIISNLEREQVLETYMGVPDRYIMLYLSKVRGESEKIKAGAYRLNAAMPLADMYDKLIEGSQDFKITIPEGKSVAEIASIVKRNHEAFDGDKFKQLTKDPSFIQRLGFNLPSLEGYLYPNTYFFGPGMKEEDLIKMMVTSFQRAADSKLRDVERRDDLTFHEHVIMASLIEREARIDADRPLIASVIFNRLKRDMPLMIDATIHYAIDDWSRPLTYDDLKVDSNYNTYKIKGLPPGPICSPRGLSLLATYRPADTDYLYYVLKGDGSHAFSRTFDEHKANIRLYRKVRPEASEQEQALAPTPTPAPSPTPLPRRGASAAAASTTTEPAAAKQPASEGATTATASAKVTAKPESTAKPTSRKTIAAASSARKSPAKPAEKTPGRTKAPQRSSR